MKGFNFTQLLQTFDSFIDFPILLDFESCVTFADIFLQLSGLQFFTK